MFNQQQALASAMIWTVLALQPGDSQASTFSESCMLKPYTFLSLHVVLEGVITQMLLPLANVNGS